MNESGRIYCASGRQACCLVEAKEKNALSENAPQKSAMIEKVIVGIQIWIRANYHSDLKLLDVIKKSGYNKHYFLRKFKQCSGVTVSSYIRNVRFNSAIKLILTTDMLISEIVQACGLHSHQQLCRAIRIRFNITPLQLREEARTVPEDLYWPLEMLTRDTN